jgi:hypothetical protein
MRQGSLYITLTLSEKGRKMAGLGMIMLNDYHLNSTSKSKVTTFLKMAARFLWKEVGLSLFCSCHSCQYRSKEGGNVPNWITQSE